jgi:NADH dehydrogenase FAD-containing subunit
VACNAESLFEEHGIDGRIPIAEAGEALLGSAPEKAQREIEQILRSRGVEVLLGSEAARITERTAHAHDGRRIGFDVAVPAVGTRPPEVFRESGLATGDDYGLWVNCYLQSISDPCVFGEGDSISFRGEALPKTHGSSPNARGRYFSTILRPT